MSLDTATTDPTLDQAQAELTRLMAADAAADGSTATEPTPDSAPKEPSTTPPAAGKEVKPSQPHKEDGTPATEESTVKPEEQKTEPGKEKAAEPSKYEKAQQRFKKSWEDLNAEKTDVRNRAASLEQREKELAQRETALKEQAAKAAEPKHKPEDYENGAKAWLAEAAKLEEAGEFDEAAEKRGLAKKATEYAKNLRANPPKPPETDAVAKAKDEAARKEYWAKAAIDFPETAKPGSPQAEALKALIVSEPGVLNDPKGMYYAARLVNAESSAARVPELSKELDGLRAKVKELEQKLTIPGDGAANNLGETDFASMSEAQQLAHLRAMASAQG